MRNRYFAGASALIATIFFMIAAILLNSASAQDVSPKGDLAVAGWLAGCWEAGTENRITEEQWMSPRGGLMVGMARSVRDGLARGHEFVMIRAGEDGAVFSAHPSGQRPADFEVTVMTNAKLRFENPTHDFPKKIEYHRIGGNRIVAKVFAEVKAEEPAFQVDYRRASCSRDRRVASEMH